MKDYVEAAKIDKQTLEKTRDFCDAVLKVKFTAELGTIIGVKAQQFGVTSDDLERVSKLMFAVADEMTKRGWQ